MNEGDPRPLIPEAQSKDHAPLYRTWSTNITDNLMPSVIALAIVAGGAGAGYGLGQEFIASGISLDLIPSAYKYGTLGLGTAGLISAGMILVGVNMEEQAD